jgi:hypothetical protein
MAFTLINYGTEGLRTLVLAKRELTQEQWEAWNKVHRAATVVLTNILIHVYTCIYHNTQHAYINYRCTARQLLRSLTARVPWSVLRKRLKKR